ncbi:MAG: DUF6143 family protein [Syntrophomonadaceae bacterium]|jgi:hypothetical protein
MAVKTKKSGLTPRTSTPQVVSLPNPFAQSVAGKYFLGQTEILTLGEGNFSWGGLINPSNSGVKLFANVFTVTNLSAEPLTARIWLNADLFGGGKTATKVSPSNTSIQPLPQPGVKLKYEESTTLFPTGGVNVFNREVPPFSTIVGEEDGKYIFSPGGAYIIFLEKTGSGLATARIAFGWWEEKV